MPAKGAPAVALFPSSTALPAWPGSGESGRCPGPLSSVPDDVPSTTTTSWSPARGASRRATGVPVGILPPMLGAFGLDGSRSPRNWA